MQGQKDIQPKMMYQVHLDSLVPADNFYRRLSAALDLNFLYKATSQYYGNEGQESIDPVVFFKVCLVGYLNNIGSDRKLIEYCSNCLDVRLFIKYDIDEPLPWHSTISRTRQLYGEEVFLELFRQVLSLCVHKGMVRGKRQAIDSAFVKANASLDSLLEKEVCDDAETYANELNEGSEYKVSTTTKKAVEQRHQWQKEAFKSKPGRGKKDAGKTDESGKDIRPRYLSNHTYYSPTDPDARVSVKPGKARQMNYYSQLAVDDAHHVITGAMADHADKRDSQCLAAIASQTKTNLALNDIVLDQLTADAGYSSAKALHYCQNNGIDAYIPNFGKYKPTREGFIYNKELDQYECQRGNRAILSFKKISRKQDNTQMKVYRSSTLFCKNCPLRSTCIGKSEFKGITESTEKPIYDAMHQKMQTPYAKRISKIRSKTVEPVLGTLINYTNMRRVNSRGIQQANKHVLMAALTYNLKKYLKWSSRKSMTIMMELQVPPKALQNTLLYAFTALFSLQSLLRKTAWQNHGCLVLT